jgi:hypothetical protein
LKKCSKCGIDQPLENFYKAKGTRDGYRGDCKACFAKRAKEWYGKPGNREKAIARVQRWQEDNPARRAVQEKRWRESGGKARSGRKSHLKRTFDLTPAEYEIKLAEQQGVCLICGRPPAVGKTLDIDHDHKTERVRGLLCRNCNHGLGKFGDDPLVLSSAIAYLFMWDQVDPADAPRVRVLIGD